MNRKDSIFQETPVNQPPRNMFDLSHEVKTSAKFGYLYPFIAEECLPGDSHINTSTFFARFAPMLFPVMHRVHIRSFFFKIPYRLLSNHWETLITGGPDGTETPVLPYATPAGIAAARAGASPNIDMSSGTLWDHFGLPIVDALTPAVDSQEQINVLPLRAYMKVWNDWFRDPNFDDEVDLEVTLQGDVSNELDMYLLRRKGWRKDYFTSALAQPQRGAQVLMPLAGTGSVTYLPSTSIVGAAPVTEGNAVIGPQLSATIKSLRDGVSSQNLQVQNIDEVLLDGGTITINDFRVALATQSWLEANARGGYRYSDQIRMHWKVIVPDYRLQRSEFIGAGKQVVRIGEVLSTTGTLTDPEVFTEGVGFMAGHGTSVGRTNGFNYYCSEYGIILGIFCIVPDSAYMQGIQKMWSRKTKFDWPFPELAHLGEQPILSKELFYSFVQADAADNNGTFGYTPRYADWKYRNDVITGDMRTTLISWHLARIFAARPVLDAEFTTIDEQGNNSDEETMRRIFQVEDSETANDYVWMQISNRYKVKRQLPYFGVPRLVG